MDKKKFTNKRAPTIGELYPNLNEQQLKEAEENLRDYLEITLRVYEHIRKNPEVYAEFKSLTASIRNPKIREEEKGRISSSK